MTLFCFFFNPVFAQTTFIPDTHFEAYLETHNSAGNEVELGDPTSMGDGMAENQLVLTNRIEFVGALYIYGQQISDLTGIEAFPNLNLLYCYSNELTSLDISHNTLLTLLNCHSNQLSALDVTHNTALRNLNLYNNHIITIDVTQNTELKELYLDENQISALDISQNTLLENLFCSNNLLNSLDVSANIALLRLVTFMNSLDTLDVSQNIALTQLRVENNQLTGLDVSKNTALTTLNCQINSLNMVNVKNGTNSLLTSLNASSNPALTCIQVDNETDANTGTGVYAGWAKDITATYAEDCGFMTGTSDYDLDKSIVLYPNPVNRVLTISSETPLTLIEIYSVLGEKLAVFHSGFTSIPMHPFCEGMYLIRMHSDQGVVTKGLIKN
jgi:hypothetical protein